MAGHSKWANIKHRKRANDAKKGKLFGKLVKEITMAAKQGGTVPESNPRLRMALQNARSANLPREKITKAIQKGSSKDAANYKEVTYEGYAIHGVAVIVTCMTDNINRTVAAVRSIFTKYGGSMGKSGSLAFLFERKGIFTVNREKITDEEAWTLAMIEAGVENIEEEMDYYHVTCALETFGRVQQELEVRNTTIIEASLRYVHNTSVTLQETTATKVVKLLEDLESHDDVQTVFHNMVIQEAH